jgi:hypothetical protein
MHEGLEVARGHELEEEECALAVLNEAVERHDAWVAPKTLKRAPLRGGTHGAWDRARAV